MTDDIHMQLCVNKIAEVVRLIGDLRGNFPRE